MQYFFCLNRKIFVFPVLLSIFFSFSVLGEENKTITDLGSEESPSVNVSTSRHKPATTTSSRHKPTTTTPKPTTTTPKPTTTTPKPTTTTLKPTASADSNFDCTKQYGSNKEYLRICKMYDLGKVRTITEGESPRSGLEHLLSMCDDCLFVVDSASPLKIGSKLQLTNKQGLLPSSAGGFLELVPGDGFQFSEEKSSIYSIVEVEDSARIGGLKIKASNFASMLNDKKDGFRATVLSVSKVSHVDLTMLDLSGEDGFNNVIEVHSISDAHSSRSLDLYLKHSFLQSSGSPNVGYINSRVPALGIHMINVVIKLNTPNTNADIADIAEQNGIVLLGVSLWGTDLTFVSDGETDSAEVKRYFLVEKTSSSVDERKSMQDDFDLMFSVNNSVFVVEGSNNGTAILFRKNNEGSEGYDRVEQLYIKFVGNIYLGEEDTTLVWSDDSIDFSGLWLGNIKRPWTGKQGEITANAFFNESMAYAGNVPVGTLEFSGHANYSSVESWFTEAVTSKKKWLPVDQNNQNIEFTDDNPAVSTTEYSDDTESYPYLIIVGVLTAWATIATIASVVFYCKSKSVMGRLQTGSASGGAPENVPLHSKP